MPLEFVIKNYMSGLFEFEGKILTLIRRLNTWSSVTIRISSLRSRKLCIKSIFACLHFGSLLLINGRKRVEGWFFYFSFLLLWYLHMVAWSHDKDEGWREKKVDMNDYDGGRWNENEWDGLILMYFWKWDKMILKWEGFNEIKLVKVEIPTITHS